jgi:hypothetical protein
LAWFERSKPFPQAGLGRFQGSNGLPEVSFRFFERSNGIGRLAGNIQFDEKHGLRACIVPGLF